MKSSMHFISGLPRSGSTLLSAVLAQNPRFSATMTSPVASLVGALQSKMSGGEFGGFFDDDKRAVILRSIFDGYYANKTDDRVIFDTNRSWSGRAALLTELYPQARIICCVREIGWIIDSIERMVTKNPLQLSRMFNFQAGASIYARVEMLMNSDAGLIGLAWSTLREAWFGQHAHRLIMIPYNHLVKYPKQTIDKLYTELGETPFVHDFSNVVYDEPNFDTHIGMPGLHTVRAKIQYQERQPCIPPDLFAKYATTHFWTNPELNTRDVKIL